MKKINIILEKIKENNSFFTLFLSFNAVIFYLYTKDYSIIILEYIKILFLKDILEYLIIFYLGEKNKFFRGKYFAYFIFIFNLKINYNIFTFFAAVYSGL